jgi:predicted Zn-dependent protease
MPRKKSGYAGRALPTNLQVSYASLVELRADNLPGTPMSLLRRRRFLRLATLALLLSGTAAALPAQTASGAAPEAGFDEHVRSANEAREAGRTDDALRSYSAAVKINPDWQEGWWSIGSLEYERDHYAQAASAFRHLAALAPAASPAWTFLGLSEFELKNYSAAREHLFKGEQLTGGHDDPEIARVAKYHLALLLVRDGDFVEAHDLLTAPARRGNASQQIKFALGLCLLHVPLLPDEVDPSQEAVVGDAGEIAELARSGDPAAAIAAFDGALLKYPKTPYLHYEYGKLLADHEKLQEALEQFQLESAISPGSSWPQMAIAAAQLRARNAPDALAAATAAVAKAPGSSAAHATLAAAYEASRNGRAAATESATAQNLLPENPVREERLIHLYALAHRPGAENAWDSAMRDYAAGRYPETIAALKPWLQENPDSGTGWAVLGLSEFASRDYENALIHLRRGQQLGLRANSENVQLAKYDLAVLLNNAGEFTAAEQLLMSIAAPGERVAQIKFALGMSLLRLRALPDQIAAPQQSLVAAAGEVAALLKDSKYDLAFLRLDDLLEKYPHAAFLHYTYGTALSALSQFDEAEKQFRAETQISPTSELSYIGIASLQLKARRPAEALKSASRATELAPLSATAHYLLGRAYLETGNTGSAVSELEIARDMTPGSPEVHFNLAKAYARAGQPAKAASERASFAELNALAERQRSEQGSQSYGAAHESAENPISTVDHAAEQTRHPQ